MPQQAWSANAVCDRLCGSIPIITPAAITHLYDQAGRNDRGGYV
jgi:hypothetical protein